MKISSKLSELKPTDLNCNVFDVYSYDGLSMQELLCQFFTKINECIKVSNETIDLASWLVNEGLKIEVVNKLMIWLEDGTLENLINVNLFNTLHTKIENINTQLAHIEKINKIINRKFKTIVGASPMYYTSKSTPQNKSYIDMDCARLSKLNIDTAQFVAHIQINNGELEVLETLENFSYSLNKFKEYGIKMNAVKLHFAYDPIDIENYGRTRWLLDYKNLITQFADIAKDEIEYFVVMNERSSIFYNSDYKEYIKEILNHARNYGYKVGVSFTNNEANQLFANDNKWLVNEVDVLFFNSYMAISNKLDKTTKQDSVIAWNRSFKTIKTAKSKTDKPIIISETGVKDYWQYLSNPASWSLGDDTIENSSNGMCSFIYFYGMFNSDIGDYVDEIWLWYPYTYHYDHNYRLFTEYLGGSYNE